MAKSPKTFLREEKAELNSLRRWKSLGEQLYQQRLQELSRPLQDMPTWFLAERFRSIGILLGRFSLLQINGGSSNAGWGQCHLSSKYAYYGGILTCIDFPRLRAIQGEKWTFDLSGHNMACVLLHCLLLQANEEAMTLFKVLKTAIKRGWITEYWLERNPVIRYSLGLCAKAYAMEHDFDFMSDFPGYREAFRCWDDSLAFSSVLSEICDFHVRNMAGADLSKTKSTQSFDGAYTLFPVEVTATLDVRSRLGLPMPNVSHDFFSSVWMKPLITSPQLDDVLSRVLPRVEELILRH